MSDQSLLAAIRSRLEVIAPETLADFDKLVNERGRIESLPDAPPIDTAFADESFGREPFLADNGYPSDAECEKISNWPVNFSKPASFEDLFEYISDRWWPDGDPGPRDNGRYRFATSGWSGNEEMISALNRNTLAWTMTWQESKRGGLHVFQIPNWKGGE